MKFILLAVLAFAALEVVAVVNQSGSAHDRPEGFLSSYDLALDRAKRLDKPVVAVFSASWCGPCQLMKSKVYSDPKVRMYRDQFVWVYLDVDEDSTHSAAIRHQVRGVPSIHVLDPKGKEISRQVGATSPREFSRFLALALAKR